MGTINQYSYPQQTNEFGRKIKGTPQKPYDLGSMLDALLDWHLERQFHGGSHDENMRRYRERMVYPGFEQQYERMPHLAQGAVDTVLEALADPLSLLGSPVSRAGTRLVGAGAKAALRSTGIGRKLEQGGSWGAKIAQEHGDAMREYARGAHNNATRHGADIAARVARMTVPQTKPLLRPAEGGGFTQIGIKPTGKRLPIEPERIEKLKHQATQRRFERNLGHLAEEPAFIDTFPGYQPRPENPWGDLIKGAAQYPRAGIVSGTPWHAVNETTNAAIRDIRTLPETLVTGARLASARLRGHEREARRLMDSGARAGAVSGEFQERQPYFQNLPLKGLGLGPLSKFNNTVVWAYSDAARQALAKRIAASGEAQGFEAGGRAAKRLVDYAHPAPVVNHLRYASTFPTWDIGVPGSVFGAAARNPALLAGENRATGGYLFDSSYQGRPRWKLDLPGGVKLDVGLPPLPTQKASKLVADFPRGAAQYARNMTSDVWRIPMQTAIEQGVRPRNKSERYASRWLTYNKTPLDAFLEYLKSGMPGGLFLDLPEFGGEPKRGENEFGFPSGRGEFGAR